MALTPGTRLGPYAITAPLGAGGMGEVYKATDTRLDRTVAIKVLPEHVASDVDLKHRFEREAKTLASLSHPHICNIHDVGSQDGIGFLVMEYLEGETLEQRLKKGALPLDQALQFGIQIADALTAAHRAGIIHRDLKPGNVMLTKSGAKLLDFGLAKLHPTAAVAGTSIAATVSRPLSGQGTILGTLHYMAPEQVEGKEADNRSDIFSFGAVVYEMATGKRAFEGKSQASLIAAILEREPASISSIQPLTPPSLDHLVSRCIAKEADDRWQSTADVLHELRWVRDIQSRPAADAPAPFSRKSRVWIATTAASVLIAGAVATLHFRETTPSQQVIRYWMPLPKEGRSEGLFFEFHISPDGQSIAVSGVLQDKLGIFVRALDSWDYRLLPGTSTGDFFWSPDSRYIAFFDDEKLKKVPVSGGPPEDICDLPGVSFERSGAWSSSDVIVFTPKAGGPLFSVPATGGTPRPVTKTGTGMSHLYPSFLPDGRHFLYTSAGGADAGIFVVSLDDEEPRRLLADQSSVQFVLPIGGAAYGHLIFARDGKLMAQRFDPDALALQGDAFLLAERALFADNGSATVSASENGILTYLGGSSRETDSRLSWFDRSGARLATEGRTGPPSPFALSPDEKLAVVLRRQPGARTGDLWLRELARGGQETRLTFDNAVDSVGNIVWSPDGTRISFSLTAPGAADLYVKDIRGAGSGEAVFRNGKRKVASDWSRDGLLLFTELDERTGADLWYLRLDGSAQGTAEPVRFLQTQFDESFGQLSPDGRFIAYLSNESGNYEVYVQPFPSGIGKRKVSTTTTGKTSTQAPRWSHDGRELFFLTGSAGLKTLMVASVSPKGAPGAVSELEIGPPRPIFEVDANNYYPAFGTFFFTVARDGRRFLFDTVEATSEPVLNVVVGWQEAFAGGK